MRSAYREKITSGNTFSRPQEKKREAEPLLLLGWFVGQTVELAIGGAVIGSGLAGTSLLRLGLMVLAGLLVWILLAIGLQVLVLAPAVRA